jgi:creatine kinase
MQAIQKDLGIADSTTAQVDPIGNFPVLTSKHKSLTAKLLRENPEIYAKLCNKKAPMGFTLDHAIQAGIDAPHLGVGVV